MSLLLDILIKSVLRFREHSFHIPRPRTMSKIRQKRLAARDHLRALGHIMSQLDLEFSVPLNPLRPVQPETEIRGVHAKGPFISSVADGSSSWDFVASETDSKHPRIVICPDEGSQMFSAWQFLLSRNVRVHLCRDELRLGLPGTVSSFIQYIHHVCRHKLQTHHLRCLQCTPGLKRFMSPYFLIWSRT